LLCHGGLPLPYFPPKFRRSLPRFRKSTMRPQRRTSKQTRLAARFLLVVRM
jgi:hypothetical protein